MLSRKEDKQHLVPEENYPVVTVCSGLHGSPKKSRISILTLIICFVVLFSFMCTGFWYINYKSYNRPLNIYLLAPDDESIIARVISQSDAKKFQQVKKPATVTSRPVTKQDVSTKSVCAALPDKEKFDCYPDSPVTEEQCISRGCCYEAVFAQKSEVSNFPPLATPYCYYPPDYVGYSIEAVTKTTDGLTADLERNIPSGFPHDIPKLKLIVTNIDENSLRIKILDADNDRFIPPIAQNVVIKKTESLNYNVDLTPLDGILSVSRKVNGAVLFSANLKQLVYSDQFLQLSTRLSTSNIYGLGEHYESFLKDVNWSRRSLFNRDNWPRGGISLYGTHPIYVAIENDTKSHGVFLLNSNAMDVILQPTPALTYRPIGGILDFFVFLGPSPSQVVEQYTNVIGRPFMPPYWSLGFHLCRYEYDTLSNTIAAWNRTRTAGIPFDTQWNDIDYMDRHNDFTYDKHNFSGLPEFVKELHKLNMHYVMIIDPGVSNTEPAGTYSPYDDGVELDIFVKNNTGGIFIGKVWNPETTVFPDFSHPSAANYWLAQFQDFYNMIEYDGAWIDMNEPANFYDGMVNGCPPHPLDDPPYVPNGIEPLRTHTLCMSAKHYANTHYNEHSLYAFREAVATYNALKTIREKRPFIISRASIAGQGVYSGHWSGDIGSSWEDLRYSIIDLLNFNIFGIPMMGSDICGFRLETTVELCARWQAVGAFYPFSRNHNDRLMKDQDPVALGEVVANATKNTLMTRYTLLPYLYTLFYQSHVFGKMVVTSLAFEFPEDPKTYPNEEQFMWGSALLIMPALYQGVTEIKVYFPNATWYDYYTGKKLNVSGQQITLPAPLDSINLAVRGGYILPQQHPSQTTVESRKNKFMLLAMLDEDGNAEGQLYWDDGDTLETYESGQYNLIMFKIQNNVLNSQIAKSGYSTLMDLDEIKVCGLKFTPSSVTIHEKTVDFDIDQYNCLKVNALVSLMQDFKVQWK